MNDYFRPTAIYRVDNTICHDATGVMYNEAELFGTFNDVDSLKSANNEIFRSMFDSQDARYDYLEIRGIVERLPTSLRIAPKKQQIKATN